MLSYSLGYSIGPVVCEAVVVGGVLAILLRGDWSETAMLTRSDENSWFGRSFGGLFMLLAIGLAVLIPIVRLSDGVIGGLYGLFRQPRMLGNYGQELAIGFIFGLAAALIAYWLTGLLLGSRGRFTLTMLLSVPGLIGSLVLSLVALSFFQLEVMNFVYDTPVPMLSVLSLYLVPRAVLLRLVFFARQPREPVFLAKLMRESRKRELVGVGRELLWVLQRRPAFWVVSLLTYWGYWDLTVASILRPTNLTPFTPGLYNLMHYGRNETLAAMTLLAGVVPLLLVAIVVATARTLRTLNMVRAT